MADQQENPADIEAYLQSVRPNIPPEDFDAYAADVRKQYGAPAPASLPSDKPNAIASELANIYRGATTPAPVPSADQGLTPGASGPVERMAEPIDSPWQTAVKLGGEATTRALGVPSGLIQALARYARGLPNASQPLKAIVGMDGQPAPRVADALKDAGVPDLGNTRSLGAKPGSALDFTGRDVLGNIAETAAMPATGLAKNALKETGRILYRQPFKQADAAIATKWRANFGPHAGTDFLYNEGKPLVGGFGMHPSEYPEAIQDLKEEAWKEMAPHLSSDSTHQLAPGLDASITKQRIGEAGAAHDASQAEAEKAFNAAEQQRYEKWQQDSLKKMANLQPTEPYLKQVFTPEEFSPGDIFDNQSNKDWLKAKLYSDNKADNQQAIKLLAEHAPNYADTISKMGKALDRAGGDREQVLPVLDSFIENAYRGPRSLQDLHALGVSYSSQARRNQAMGADATAYNSLRNEKKAGQMNFGRDMADAVDQQIEDNLGSTDSWSQAKQKYALAKKLQDPMNQLAKQYGGKPAVTAVDGALMGAGLLGHLVHGNYGEFLPLLGKKVAEQFHRPRLATGLGSALGRASQSNIWDKLLMQHLLTSPDLNKEPQ